MIRIAICEDEKPQSEYVQSLLMKWEKASGRKVSIDSYNDAEQFIFGSEDKQEYDLLILDIEMGKMNGVELARKIRRERRDTRIVFLTGYKDFVFEGYEVGAIRYLLKPMKENQLFELMEAITKEMEQKQKEYFIFHCDGKLQKVEFRDILYIESNGHYLTMKTGTEFFEWKASLISVEEDFLKAGYGMIRRGLYVNPKHIKKIGKTECILDNNEILPVSKSRYKEINQSFITYYKGKAE